jgi:Flp pilus assembly protein TadD
MTYYGKIFVVGLILAIVLLQGCSQIQTVFQSKEMSVKNSVSQTDESLFEEAKHASDNGDKSRAEEIYREYIRKHPQVNANALGVAYARLGMLLSEKKEYQESRDCFEKAMNYKPDNLEICGAYANSLFEQEDYIGAESLWRQGLQISPNDKRFQMMLGYTLAQEKKYQSGISYLKRAVGEQKAYEEMASIYRSHEEYDKAIAALNQLQKLRFKEHQTEQQLGYAVNQQNRYQNANDMVASMSAAPNIANNVQLNNRIKTQEISQPPYNNQYNNPPAYMTQQIPTQPPQFPMSQQTAHVFLQSPQQYPYQPIPVSNLNSSGIQGNAGFASTLPSPAIATSTQMPTQRPPQSIMQNGYSPSSPQPSNYENYYPMSSPNMTPQQSIPNRQTELPSPEMQSPGVQPAGMPYGFASSQPTVNPPQPFPNRSNMQYDMPQEIAQRPYYDMPPIQNYPTHNQRTPYYAIPTESVPQSVNPLARASYGSDVPTTANPITGNAVSGGQIQQVFHP